STRPNIDVETHREAVGVFGLITPWNFPIAIPAWKSAPALAFGNTVVLKPATPTPAIAHALGEILIEAGAPPGVFNLVIGEGDVGRAIVAPPDTEGIHDRFVEALAEKARSLRVGDALDPQTQIGPAVSEQQLEQNLRYVKIALDDGGKVLPGGPEPLKMDQRGWYMTPTVISDTQ